MHHEKLKHQSTIWKINSTVAGKSWTASQTTSDTNLLHSKEFNNVDVIEFLQHLKLPHLNFIRPVVAHQVKDLHGNQLTSFLQQYKVSFSKVWPVYDLFE